MFPLLILCVPNSCGLLYALAVSCFVNFTKIYPLDYQIIRYMELKFKVDSSQPTKMAVVVHYSLCAVAFTLIQRQKCDMTKENE